MRVDLPPVRIVSVGVVAPGLTDWSVARDVLTGRRAWTPAPLTVPPAGFLPATERRRVGATSLLALACAMQAMSAAPIDPAGVASVFASTDGDAENTHRICLDLTESEPSLSPTRFHNSVQNAASGYWSILTGSRAPTTMLTGEEATVAHALLEAVMQVAARAGPVLMVVYDLPMPEPLQATHPIEQGGAISLLIDSGRGQGAGLRIGVVPSGPAAAGALDPVVAGVPSGPMAALGRSHPIGPALPLLTFLSAGRPGRLAMRLDDRHALAVSVDAGALSDLPGAA